MRPLAKRSKLSQEAYNEYLKQGKEPFKNNTILQQWQHWKLIKNEFPYDNLFLVHDLLIPKMPVAKFSDLSEQEKTEYNKILNELEPFYDTYLINMPKKRTVPAWWHNHLVVWKMD